MENYEKELRSKIAELGGKAGSRASIETLEGHLRKLESDAIAEAVFVEETAIEEMQEETVSIRKWTISRDRRDIKTEVVKGSDEITISIPAGYNAHMVKHILFWFGKVCARFMKCRH